MTKKVDRAGSYESNGDWLRKIAKELHYPQCWDTAAYPSLWHAIYELARCDKCSECTAAAPDMMKLIRHQQAMMEKAREALEECGEQLALLAKDPKNNECLSV